MKNVLAYTDLGSGYPGFISINRNDAGDVAVHVRAAPVMIKGVRVCGHDCHPGKFGCNNYCNRAPEIGPMADRPADCTHTREGAQASFTIPAAAWPYGDPT